MRQINALNLSLTVTRIHVVSPVLGFFVFSRMAAYSFAMRIPGIDGLADRILVRKLNVLLKGYGHAECTTDVTKSKPAVSRRRVFGEAQLHRTLTTRPDAEALTSRVMAGNAWPSDLPAFEASCVHFENCSDGTTCTSKCATPSRWPKTNHVERNSLESPGGNPAAAPWSRRSPISHAMGRLNGGTLDGQELSEVSDFRGDDNGPYRAEAGRCPQLLLLSG
jgi:hypothetical protein